MAELYGASRCFVGMTATLINGYSSGIFHLLYRIVPGLMLKDGKRYKSPGDFDAEYGVVENTYEIHDAEYNSNRRTSKRRTKSKQLPGVSPLVFSRFLLEYTAFLSLSDMGKDLPDYEEIPVPLEMPEDVRTAYKEAEHELQKVLRTDRKAAQKILSTYLNLLTVYPDQPYDQPEVVHPINGMPIVTPKNCGDFSRLLPKEERVLELVRQKAANGERVLIYTSWTRTDSQKKLQKLLCSEGYRTEILTPQIATDKREDWVNKRVKGGLQVLITNPRCVETGLDLNAFTTIIFYSMGYNLFTLRQASRRSWRINQTAPRVEVYMLYYSHMKKAELVLKGYVSESSSTQLTSLNIAINGGLAMGHYWKGRLLLEQAKQDHDRCNDYKDAAIASFCATNVTERFDHLPENADEDAAPQLSPPQWLSAIELLRYPDRAVFRVDRRMVFQTIYQKLTQQVEEVQSDNIQIHNERYRLTKKDVRSNLERCLDMVKAQFPDKEPLIQKMIRSIR